jgi:hypothetical protein
MVPHASLVIPSFVLKRLVVLKNRLEHRFLSTQRAIDNFTQTKLATNNHQVMVTPNYPLADGTPIKPEDFRTSG